MSRNVSGVIGAVIGLACMVFARFIGRRHPQESIFDAQGIGYMLAVGAFTGALFYAFGKQVSEEEKQKNAKRSGVALAILVALVAAVAKGCRLGEALKKSEVDSAAQVKTVEAEGLIPIRRGT